MTNTYDTSNFLPCPFCGAAPEAIDWPGGPMAKVFIHCPNDNYDSEDGGCSVGPDVVGSDIEQAAARWNRRAQVPDDLPPVPYNEHEKKLLKEIESRDYWEEKATELAERVGGYFGFDVGEHSNANCPVQTALEAEWQPPQAAVPEGYVAIGKSDLVTRREYGETADEASEKMERTGFYTYEIKELYALQPAPAAVPEVSGHNVRLISQSMAFLASAIKSGEAWSEQCQHIYDRAQNTLSEIASPHPAETEEKSR